MRYDALDLRDIYATLGYVLGHRDELQAYLERARERSSTARRDAEQRSSTDEIRERLTREREAPRQTRQHDLGADELADRVLYIPL